MNNKDNKRVLILTGATWGQVGPLGSSGSDQGKLTERLFADDKCME